MEIVVADSAWTDLDQITDYIAQDSIRFAKEFSTRVFDRIDQLYSFPKSGRVVPEFKNEDIRELIFGKYRIVYRTYPDRIVIIRIIHGAKILE